MVTAARGLNHRVLGALALAALLASCAGAARGGAGAPVELSPGYPELRARFDADARRPRLLVLASPT